MAVPALTRISPTTPRPANLPAGVQAFSVARGGEFAGRRFSEGEIALVGGAVEEGEALVLVALGHGRPRLGTVRGSRLIGDRGEPCLTSRWEVAGRLLGIARPVGAGWAVDAFDAPGIVGMAPSAAPEQGAPASVGGRSMVQLSLFAA